MQSFLADDGKVYPVRDDFLIFPDGWSQAEEDSMLEKHRAQGGVAEFLCAPRDHAITRDDLGRLLSIMLEPWTDRQREMLKAWDNRNNINSAIRYLDGRDYREFGFDTVCQVHGNRHTRTYTCGCSFHVLFDHHLEHVQNEDIKVLRSEHICDGHRHHNDLDAAYWASTRDSAAAA